MAVSVLLRALVPYLNAKNSEVALGYGTRALARETFCALVRRLQVGRAERATVPGCRGLAWELPAGEAPDRGCAQLNACQRLLGGHPSLQREAAAPFCQRPPASARPLTKRSQQNSLLCAAGPGVRAPPAPRLPLPPVPAPAPTSPQASDALRPYLDLVVAGAANIKDDAELQGKKGAGYAGAAAAAKALLAQLQEDGLVETVPGVEVGSGVGGCCGVPSSWPGWRERAGWQGAACTLAVLGAHGSISHAREGAC